MFIRISYITHCSHASHFAIKEEVFVQIRSLALVRTEAEQFFDTLHKVWNRREHPHERSRNYCSAPVGKPPACQSTEIASQFYLMADFSEQIIKANSKDTGQIKDFTFRHTPPLRFPRARCISGVLGTSGGAYNRRSSRYPYRGYARHSDRARNGTIATRADFETK